MKGKILTLIIGILIGAIITTTGFLIYNKTLSKNSNQSEMTQMDGNGQMGEPSKENGQNGGKDGNMEEPPSKPSGDNGEEPPAKPDDTNSNSNS